MKYFLDSAKLDEIDYAYENYCIDGVTTNPRHIMLSGKPFLTVVNDLANWVKAKELEGKEKFPISVEVNPFLNNWKDMFDEGKKIAKVSENFVIKIPCTKEGLIAAKRLELEGISTNVTLVFSPSQAIAAAKLNAYFVSPFIGWKESSGEDTSEYIRAIVDIYNNYGYETEIIVAAVRNGNQISQAAKIGADIVTCGLDVYEASFEHAFTTYGMGVFQKAWDETAK